MPTPRTLFGRAMAPKLPKVKLPRPTIQQQLLMGRKQGRPRYGPTRTPHIGHLRGTAIPGGRKRFLKTSTSTSRPHIMDVQGHVSVALSRGTSNRRILTNIHILMRLGWAPKQALRTALLVAQKSHFQKGRQTFRVSRTVRRRF